MRLDELAAVGAQVGGNGRPVGVAVFQAVHEAADLGQRRIGKLADRRQPALHRREVLLLLGEGGEQADIRRHPAQAVVQVLEQQFLLAQAGLPVGGAFVPGAVRVRRLLREREQGTGQRRVGGSEQALSLAGVMQLERRRVAQRGHLQHQAFTRDGDGGDRRRTGADRQGCIDLLEQVAPMDLQRGARIGAEQAVDQLRQIALDRQPRCRTEASPQPLAQRKVQPAGDGQRRSEGDPRAGVEPQQHDVEQHDERPAETPDQRFEPPAIEIEQAVAGHAQRQADVEQENEGGSPQAGRDRRRQAQHERQAIREHQGADRTQHGEQQDLQHRAIGRVFASGEPLPRRQREQAEEEHGARRQGHGGAGARPPAIHAGEPGGEKKRRRRAGGTWSVERGADRPTAARRCRTERGARQRVESLAGWAPSRYAASARARC